MAQERRFVTACTRTHQSALLLRYYCRCLFTAIILLGPSKGLLAQDSTAIAVDRIVQQIKPVLDQKRVKVVSVGGFTGVGGTSSGPEIQMKLVKAIGKLDGFAIDRSDFDVMISGRLERLELANALGVKIVAQLFDANNRPIGQFEASAEVLGVEAVPRLLGITTTAGGSDTNLRHRQLQTDSQLDPCVIKGTQVFAGEDSKYSLELLVKDPLNNTYQPIPPEKTGRRGNAFAPISRLSIFAIRLRNYTNSEAAVNLTLDGISCFAFSEVRPGSVHWLVPAASGAEPGAILVRGWDKNDSESFEFRAVDYPESAAKTLKIEPNETIGQICAQFSELVPMDREHSRAVGIGEVVLDKKISVSRNIGDLQSTIQIRYEKSSPASP